MANGLDRTVIAEITERAGAFGVAFTEITPEMVRVLDEKEVLEPAPPTARRKPKRDRAAYMRLYRAQKKAAGAQ